MSALQYLLTVAIDLYLILSILRIWLQIAEADFYHPVSQFIVKATQPIVGPLRRILPSLGRIDTSSLLLAFTVAGIKSFLLYMMYNQPLNIGTLSLLSLLICIKEAGILMFFMLIIRAVLSWFSQGHSSIDTILAQLTEPLMGPVRRLLPSLGGLDISPMLLIIGLNAMNLLIPDILSKFGVAYLWQLA